MSVFKNKKRMPNLYGSIAYRMMLSTNIAHGWITIWSDGCLVWARTYQPGCVCETDLGSNCPVHQTGIRNMFDKTFNSKVRLKDLSAVPNLRDILMVPEVYGIPEMEALSVLAVNVAPVEGVN